MEICWLSTGSHAASRRTGHDREDLLHELQVVDLVELRREVAALERLADLEQQAEPRVRDVALREHTEQVSVRLDSVPALIRGVTLLPRTSLQIGSALLGLGCAPSHF